MEFGVSLINVSSLHELLTNLPELLAPLYSFCMSNSIKYESVGHNRSPNIGPDYQIKGIKRRSKVDQSHCRLGTGLLATKCQVSERPDSEVRQ